MTKVELGMLVEKIILIRDRHRNTLSIEELDDLADACNIINRNLELLREDKDAAEKH